MTPTLYQSLGRVHSMPRGLFRRHVADRSHDLPLAPTLSRSRRQAEIEQNHTALEGDKDVGRLDVPVQAFRPGERTDPFGELPEGLTQPLLVESETWASATPGSGWSSSGPVAGYRGLGLGAQGSRLGP